MTNKSQDTDIDDLGKKFGEITKSLFRAGGVGLVLVFFGGFAAILSIWLVLPTISSWSQAFSFAITQLFSWGILFIGATIILKIWFFKNL